MVDEQLLATSLSYRFCKIFDACEHIEVQTADEVSSRDESIGMWLLTVKLHDAVGILHPSQKVREIVWHDDIDILPLPLQIFIQPKRRTYSIAVGWHMANDDNVATVVKEFLHISNFCWCYLLFEHNIIYNNVYSGWYLYISQYPLSRILISITKLRKKEIQKSRFAKKKGLNVEKKKKKGATDYEMNILY